MKLVDDARRCWRWISVQAMVVAAAIQGAWVFIPDDMRESFPKNWVQGVTAALLLFGIAGRLVVQTPPAKEPENPTIPQPPPQEPP
jgi:hypothetical protein